MPAVAPKYKVGQLVRLLNNWFASNRHPMFKVLRLARKHDGVNQYWLKSVTNGHERVVAEGEITSGAQNHRATASPFDPKTPS